MRSDCSQPLRGTSISAPLALPWASMKLDILPRTPRCTGTCNRPGALVSPSRRLGVLGYPLRPTAPFGDTCAPGPWESPRLAFRSRWGIPRGLCAQGRLPGAGSASSSPWLPASGPAATAATRRQKLTLRSGGAVSQQPLGGLARSIEDPRETPHQPQGLATVGARPYQRALGPVPCCGSRAGFVCSWASSTPVISPTAKRVSVAGYTCTRPPPPAVSSTLTYNA